MPETRGLKALPVVTEALTLDLRNTEPDRQRHAVWNADLHELTAGSRIHLIVGSRLPEDGTLDMLADVACDLSLWIEVESTTTRKDWVDGLLAAIARAVAQ